MDQTRTIKVMKRREFIQTTSLAALGAATLSSFSLSNKPKIGLQLYSLRDIIKQDPKGVLEKVAGFGYKKLETYDYEDGRLFGLTSKEFGTIAQELGMKITSGHYHLGWSPSKKSWKGTLMNEWERAVIDAKENGQEFMVLAHLEEDERKSLDDYKFVIEQLNKAAEICHKNNIQLSYHNHDYEFDSFEGQVAYELMLKELDPKLVSMELDLYWVKVAKLNPLDYFAKYPGRFEQWHVKDMDKVDPKKQVDLGTGCIDFPAIFAKSKQAGLKHFYVEQEAYPVSAIQSIEENIKVVREWF